MAHLTVQCVEIGLDRCEMARLGERFFRVLGSAQTGSGLGWSIVWRIARRDGARVKPPFRHSGRPASPGALATGEQRVDPIFGRASPERTAEPARITHVFSKNPTFRDPLGCAGGLGLELPPLQLAGVALVGGALVMWQLLHFTRMLQVLKRAASRPIGHVDSAGDAALQVAPRGATVARGGHDPLAGPARIPEDSQPERFRWSDTSGSSALCVFGWQVAKLGAVPAEPPATR